MILGVGIDIIEVARIRAANERFGGRFIDRILLPSEIAYCGQHRDPNPHLAARFAAKEAISKAFGTGIGAQLGWHDMEVRRRDSGQPFVVMHGRGELLLARFPLAHIQLSLSHTATSAVAVAVIEAGSAMPESTA